MLFTLFRRQSRKAVAIPDGRITGMDFEWLDNPRLHHAFNKARPTVTGLFPLGRTVATPGALEALKKNQQRPVEFLAKHQAGDWGCLGEEDKKANDLAVKDGLRILSAYDLKDGTKIWIITESDRSSSCVLLPEEY